MREDEKFEKIKKDILKLINIIENNIKDTDDTEEKSTGFSKALLGAFNLDDDNNEECEECNDYDEDYTDDFNIEDYITEIEDELFRVKSKLVQTMDMYDELLTKYRNVVEENALLKEKIKNHEEC